MQNRIFLFVINPIAGGNDKRSLPERIDRFALEEEVTAHILETTGQDDPKRIRREIRNLKPDVVVACGGDGTVNLVAEVLAHTEITLGILPLGSGNGLAKDLNIPHVFLEQAFELLAHGKARPIDTLEANGRFFLHLCDLGFNAHIVRLFNQGKKRGFRTYLKYTLREFLAYKTEKFKVKADGNFFRGRAFMVTIANTNRFGSNLAINPDGKEDDGFFEVIVIKRFPRSKAIGLFFALLARRLQFSPYTLYFKCKKVKVICKKRSVLQVDGEIVGETRGVHVKLHPRSLHVITPQTK